MIASTLGDIGSLVGGLAAVGVVVGGFFAGRTTLAQLGMQRRENRGRWLTELSARFSDTPSFVTVRGHLHRGEDSPLVAALQSRQAHERGDPNELTPEDAKLLVALDDYLDFLGLIEYLVEHDYLDEYAAWKLFDWYVIDQLDVGPVHHEIDDSFPQVKALRELFERLREEERQTLK